MVSKVAKRKAEAASSASKFSETISASWNAYYKQVSADQRLQLIDSFLVALVVGGVIQFLFACVVGDSFPLNAFLAGFCACVGQFVLLVSLRMQWVEPFPKVSRDRAFLEFVGGSLVLHFLCLHFVN
ncbi:LAME_0H12684g1_1 [Lachancea meyersii CBS 8951]|uniref:Dolichyl-diphosphooligosaccharide--protein glycosyltransferase subunit OST2 n=1 Tax=Lachancea meyersii CBS 8951 TaxID=1266667 RepID=A0A1G4KGM0_9SACH|nr:LAME_0H12684g1_1 [Lachancea meyersii CBS 8951]